MDNLFKVRRGVTQQASSYMGPDEQWFWRQTAKAVLLLAIFYFGLGVYAWAEDTTFAGAKGSFELFDTFLTEQEKVSKGWQTTVTGFMLGTFKALVVIEFAWAAMYWALQKDSLNSLSVEMIKKIMVICFFYWLLQEGPNLAAKIIDSLAGGADKGGVAGKLLTVKAVTADLIVAKGVAACNKIWQGAPTGFFSVLGNIHKIIVAAFACLIVIICFFIIAAQWVCIKIESFIMLAAGAVFLGFGASSVLKTHTEKYFSYALNVGVRLLTLTLVMAMMLTQAEKVASDYAFEISKMMQIAGMAVLTCLLAAKVPEMASSAFGASFGLSAGGVTGSAQSGVSSAMSIASGALSAGRLGQAGLGKVVSAAQGARHAHQFAQASRPHPEASLAGAVGGILKKGGGGNSGGERGSAEDGSNSIASLPGDKGGVNQSGNHGDSKATSNNIEAGGNEDSSRGTVQSDPVAQGKNPDVEPNGSKDKPSSTSPYRKVGQHAHNAAAYSFGMGRAFLNAGANGLGKFLTGKDYLGGQLAKLQREQGVSADSSSSRPGSLHVYRDLKRLQAKTGQTKPSDPPKGI